MNTMLHDHLSLLLHPLTSQEFKGSAHYHDDAWNKWDLLIFSSYNLSYHISISICLSQWRANDNLCESVAALPGGARGGRNCLTESVTSR